jgi:multidrug efflux system outer membrane protein
MGPNYKRPRVEVPVAHRGADTELAAQSAEGVSIGDQKWSDLFDDDVLTKLVDTALEQNFDLRIASERILQARAQYRIARSDLFPTIGADASFVSNRGSSAGSIIFIPRGTGLDVSYTEVGFTLGWELDVWGRLRRLKESERAQYLAVEEARHGVVTTLVSDVVGTYLSLRELDFELEIARKNQTLAEDRLRLTNAQHDQGIATGLDVSQAQQFVHTVGTQIAAIERAIGQTENGLSLLLGNNPGEIPRGRTLVEFSALPQVPAGLPSSLLEQRPDVRQAERTLVAANALIGAARARYFPQISLSGFLGGQSRDLSSLLTAPARLWNFTPSATAPIFSTGRRASSFPRRNSEKRN